MKKVGLLLAAALVALIPLLNHAETLRVSQQPTGIGWLERDDGQLILHLSGSWRDMGRQQGELLKEEVGVTVRAMTGMAHRELGKLPPAAVDAIIFTGLYLPYAPWIPAEMQEEMRGLAETSGQSLNAIRALHALILVNSCSGTAAWGKATRDGELYQTRSLDFGLDIIDPKTNVPIQDYSLVVVYQPQGGVPFVTFSWPGFLGSIGGMNTSGVCLSEMTDSSRLEFPAGAPMIFRMKKTLYAARSLDEAVRIMTRPPFDGGYNFLVGGGNERRAVAIEMDPAGAYVGGWDGKAESSSYRYEGRQFTYTPLEDVLIRTNHPLSLGMVRRHHPGDEIWGPGRKRDSYPRYADLRARAEAGYGTWDLESLFIAQREHYAGLCDGKQDDLCQATIYQAAYAPRSGDFIIGFAHGDPDKLGRYQVSAYSQPYHRYNLSELLVAKP